MMLTRVVLDGTGSGNATLGKPLHSENSLSSYMQNLQMGPRARGRMRRVTMCFDIGRNDSSPTSAPMKQPTPFSENLYRKTLMY